MSEQSGAQWCTRFPTSAFIDDLVDPFRTAVHRFVDALRAGGATVTISATYRPPERAYLMHWCCMIADTGQDPATVPPMAGVDIDWTHGGDIEDARDAAMDMKMAYRIRFPAALHSRHTQRLAIDMAIAVPAGSVILDATGARHNIDTPATGPDPRIVAIGVTYSVIKLRTDPPHWSSDGH